jgi:hypothetical protein
MGFVQKINPHTERLMIGLKQKGRLVKINNLGRLVLSKFDIFVTISCMEK